MVDREKVIEELQKANEILGKVEEPTFWLDFVQVALRNALELLKEQRWISVKDRLPERFKTVLVAVFGHDLIVQRDGETLEDAINRTFETVRYVTTGSIDETDDWNGSDGYPMMVQPSYWMPLPEPPGEEHDEP